ncbi:MAG: tryptophan 2,3-dioxygenase [Bacteroidetes bacterium]|nr:tryptophan 2,3-dioxygenase [Bacteroidota bacterium]
MEPKMQEILDTIKAQCHFQEILNKIKEQYQFQNDKELMGLLEGLASSENKGVTYWDYIETDTLLSLQKPKTNYPDENIFIIYHQTCELYFKLIIQEIERLNDFYEPVEKRHYAILHQKFSKDKKSTVKLNQLEVWEECIGRINRYWKTLIASFDVLKSGLSSAEFMVFRNSLIPASGFQTYQFRIIEIMLTPFENLQVLDSNNQDVLYWQKGAMQNTNKEKASKLLLNFSQKYDTMLSGIVDSYNGKTVLDRYKAIKDVAIQTAVRPLIERTEELMLLWKIAHMHMIFRHIPNTESATGGTDYTNYLPQLREDWKDESKKDKHEVFNKHQQVIYFPEFWRGRQHNQYIADLITKLPGEIAKMVDDMYGKENPSQVKRMAETEDKAVV